MKMRGWVAGALLLLSFEARSASYVALGDSITSGTNAAKGAFGQEYSWAVGKKLERTFAKALGERVDRVHALSVPGAITPVLKAQTLVAEKLRPRFVSVEIGGNDFAWGLGHQVLPDLRWVISRLSQLEPRPHIFVGTVPDLEKIYQVGQGRWHCEVMHWLAPFFLKASDQKREEVRDHIRETNRQIVALATEFPHITVVEALSEDVIEAEDISSVDCIHPSVRGQQRIADAFIAALQAKFPGNAVPSAEGL